jgi:hypothetical protein
MKTTVVMQPIVTASTLTMPSMIWVDTTYSRDPDFFLYDRSVIAEHCTDKLCLDAKKYFIPYTDAYYEDAMILDVDNSNKSEFPDIPLLLQHGDAGCYTAKEVSFGTSSTNDDQNNVTMLQTKQFNPNVPLIKKFRRSMPKNAVEFLLQQKNEECFASDQYRGIPSTTTCTTDDDTDITNTSTTNRHIRYLQPIVSVVSNFGRHFNPLNDIVDVDIVPWDEKIPMAIYRGRYTGRTIPSSTQRRVPSSSQRRSDQEAYEQCQNVLRCRLVYNGYNSTIIDAKMTHVKRRMNGNTIHDVPVTAPTMSMADMLRYKGIIMLEGNDVASGLKWSLFSQSVVLTQPPTYTSWAMEELLVPWVHYIPLNEDVSDVEEKVQWMIDHDEEAEKIAHNGHLWMTDMMFHPQAMQDHEEILAESIRRYRAHFMYNPTLLS